MKASHISALVPSLSKYPIIFYSEQPCEVTIATPILQLKTLSLGEVREFAQCLQLDGAELGLEPRSPDSKDHALALIIPKCTFCLCQIPRQFRADRNAGGAARKPLKVYKESYHFCQVFCQGCFFQRCPEWKGKFETPKKLLSSTQGF